MIMTITTIDKQNTSSSECHDYPCSLCGYFHPDRGGWGVCELMNVHVHGGMRACKLSTPFVCPKNKNDYISS